MWATKSNRLFFALSLAMMLLASQPAAAWRSDCSLSDGASVVSHQATDFEIIIFYAAPGQLDFMGFFLGEDTPYTRYGMEKINISIDSDTLSLSGCVKLENGTNALLCSVDREANPRLLRELDGLMRKGQKLSISGAGSVSLVGYTSSARDAIACP